MSRPRVLVSAYSCEPGRGSEPGAGWAFARAAAAHHDVWLVTRRRSADAIETALAAEPDRAAHLHVHYLELGDRALAMKRHGYDVYWYYAGWQRRLGQLADDLHHDVGFDVAHHATFASDWLPCGLAGFATRRGVPLVWGPVGGATLPPVGLLSRFGPRALAGEGARALTTGILRRTVGHRVARTADLVVALNDDTARHFAYAGQVLVEPNAAIDVGTAPADDERRPGPGTGSRTAIFVGRLETWKGAGLAIEAIARRQAAGWRLELYGSGPDRRRFAALAERLGVGDRVRFAGQAPRTDALAALHTADAMLFPSMHDSAPWAVAEAAAVGLPVVCLDRGGPPQLTAGHGVVVPATGDVIGGLARALADLDADHPGHRPTDRWSPDRLDDMVAGWYAQAIAPAGRPTCTTDSAGTTEHVHP